MIYDLSKDNQLFLFNKQNTWLIENKKVVDQKEIKKTRTTLLNSALHLYFEHISEVLNGLGITFSYKGLNVPEIETPYTAKLVKDMIWRPIQLTLFEKESTTKLNAKEINQIIDVLSKFFADRKVQLVFPSIESLIDYNK